MELVTGAMGSLLPKLGELLKDEYNLERRVRKGVSSLQTELTMMHAALRKVAEVPPDQLDEQVQIWAGKVRELSYDMEDAVDNFMVRVEEGHDCEPAGANLKNRLKKFLKKTTRLFTKGRALHAIAAAMEEAQNLAKQLADLRQRYGLETHNTSAGATIDPRLMAMFKDVEELVGIDSTRDELIEMLTEGDDESKQRLRTVSIVGFGGLGKTTLANVVYQKFKAQFDCGAFVSVSQNPDAKKIFKDMLYQFDKKEYKNIHESRMDETRLIHEIREFLQSKSKRYLVVIDDIWDVKAWEVIKCALIENDRGNRVITTTRLSNVAQKVGGAYELKPLCPASSKILFYGRIFGGEDKCPDQLAGVSEIFLKKCGGVPLAIITVASLLASKMQDAREWKMVLDSIGTGLENSPDVKDMRKILALSFYDLPCHLKACLLYLSVFPEDYVIGSAQLIWRWIAEGFVQPGKQGTSLFEVGESYLNELINRSMVQPVYINWEGSVQTCRVHDMVLDLICDLSSQENFVTILDGTEQSTPNSQSKVRRLSLQNSKVDETTPPDSVSTTPLVSVSQVRSIIIFQRAINLMPPLSSFDVLRVLDLEGCFGEIVPLNLRHVGNLFHLRYLGLAHTRIHELPEEIGELKFLQVLDITGNAALKELPLNIVKLRRLMCLLSFEYSLRFPDGMGNLTSMEVLHGISTEGCPNIVKELRTLTRLRELKIYFGEDESLEEDFVESLRNLHNIQSLVISGYFRSMDFLGERWVCPRHLRKFRLEYLSGVGAFSTLPAWVKKDPLLLSNLLELCICVKELRQEDLQILGALPALHDLEIQSTHQTKRLLLGADLFRCVISFSLLCEPTGHIMFQRGALPRAIVVDFPFNVRMATDDGNGDFDLGLGNLLSLLHVFVTIHYDGAAVGEAKEAEALLRHAVDAHPNHPTIEICPGPAMTETRVMERIIQKAAVMIKKAYI